MAENGEPMTIEERAKRITNDTAPIKFREAFGDAGDYTRRALRRAIIAELRSAVGQGRERVLAQAAQRVIDLCEEEGLLRKIFNESAQDEPSLLGEKLAGEIRALNRAAGWDGCADQLAALLGPPAPEGK